MFVAAVVLLSPSAYGTDAHSYGAERKPEITAANQGENETPNEKGACNAADLTEVGVLDLSKTELIKLGYNNTDIETLKVDSLFRDSDQAYPRFLFELRGFVRGRERIFGGAANGCGILAIWDFGSPPPTPQWRKLK